MTFQRVLLCVAAFISGVSLTVFAQSMSPVGLWQTIDDETNKPKSLIRITEKDGVFSGTIEKLLDPSTDQNARCDKCDDDDPRKGQRILGMTNLTELRRDGDIYVGKILDPAKGSVYKSKVKVIDGGKKLEMTGSFLFFSRTQTWNRVE